jgi:hypothetical protein
MDTKQPGRSTLLCFQSKSFTLKTQRPQPQRPSRLGTKPLGNHVITRPNQQ